MLPVRHLAERLITMMGSDATVATRTRIERQLAGGATEADLATAIETLQTMRGVRNRASYACSILQARLDERRGVVVDQSGQGDTGTLIRAVCGEVHRLHPNNPDRMAILHWLKHESPNQEALARKLEELRSSAEH